MNKQDMDDIFIEKVRARFQASLGTLTPGTLASLSQARRKAVDAVAQPAVRSWGWRMPAGAVALAFVGVVGGALWTGGGNLSTPSPFTNANTDAPLMMAGDGDNLDMYADMDFYQWMETEDQPTAAPDDGTVDDSGDDEEDDDTGVGG